MSHNINNTSAMLVHSFYEDIRIKKRVYCAVCREVVRWLGTRFILVECQEEQKPLNNKVIAEDIDRLSVLKSVGFVCMFLIL